MTPAARVQAAIDVLETYSEGTALEAAFLRWSRKSRFAGSKDRAAIRDLIFEAVRKRRSLGAWPEAPSVRLWMARLLVERGDAPEALFGQPPYGPDALNAAELEALAHSIGAVPDVPDWIEAEIRKDYADDADAILATYSNRAPITLRVNRRKGSRDQVAELLSKDGVETVSNTVAPFALTVMAGERRIAQSKAFLEGWIEMQDASSQALCEDIDTTDTILDYCAGGGGKALALADRGGNVTAHDINAKRMSDIPNRAERAGVRIGIAQKTDLKRQSFDTVLCDLPCSGSGTWRRTPDAKWRFTGDDLDTLVQMQRNIISEAVHYVRPGGHLYLATCSIFSKENQAQLDWALRTIDGLDVIMRRQFMPCLDNDGFFASKLRLCD